MADWPRHHLQKADSVTVKVEGHTWEMSGSEFVACLEAGGWTMRGHETHQPREFTDSVGCLRRGTKWGFNAFVTEQGARTYARSAVKRHTKKFWIWKLPDGTFDYTFVKGPPHGNDGPIEDAELIGEGTT